MKKSVFAAALLLTGLAYKVSDAQIHVHVGLNFGAAPVYEQVQPVPVDDVQYADDDNYYYLPDVDAYYDIADQLYFYNDGDRWVSASYLPGRYHDFDWRYARHYEIKGRRPFMRADFYRERFNGFAGGNPNWREHDSRFNSGFAPDHGMMMDGPRGGFAHREGGFQNRDHGQPFNGNDGFRGGYNPQGGYAQNNHFNHGGNNFGQGPAENNGNFSNPNRNNGQGMNPYNGNENRGQFNGQDRGQGGFQDGGRQNNQPASNQGGFQNSGHQNNQLGNNQGNHNMGNGNMQQHFVSNNNPRGDRSNAMFGNRGRF